MGCQKSFQMIYSLPALCWLLCLTITWTKKKYWPELIILATVHMNFSMKTYYIKIKYFS